MFRMTSVLVAPAFVALMGGTAHAALTADQLWQSWKEAGARVGLEVSAATENSADGVLTLNGVSVAPAGGKGLTISDLVMTTAPSGVTIVPGSDISLALSDDSAIVVTHDGMSLTVYPAEGGTAYDLAAKRADIAYAANFPSPALSEDGGEAPMMNYTSLVSLVGLAGTYTDSFTSQAEALGITNRRLTLDVAADTFEYLLSLSSADQKINQTSQSTTSDVNMSFGVTLPATMALSDMASTADFGKALQEGLGVNFTITQGETAGSTSQEGGATPINITFKAGGGTAEGLFNKDTFTMSSNSLGLELSGTAATLPAPFELSAGPAEFRFAMPVMSGEMPGDYALLMKLTELRLNEETWALFDPGAVLNRDPVDLAIDISGKAKLDLPAVMAANEAGTEPQPAPAPETLNLNELSVKLAGAALSATGAFTFDNATGTPEPVGEANVLVTGANQLIDGLIKAGLITQDDATGARMMMGGFMTPGANPDELTSKIEARAGGEIYVNGQRIQ